MFLLKELAHKLDGVIGLVDELEMLDPLIKGDYKNEVLQKYGLSNLSDLQKSINNTYRLIDELMVKFHEATCAVKRKANAPGGAAHE